jgi:hypothetical protein
MEKSGRGAEEKRSRGEWRNGGMEQKRIGAGGKSSRGERSSGAVEQWGSGAVENRMDQHWSW